MSEGELKEELNQAIDAMIASGGEIPSGLDEQTAELLVVVSELRQLPRAEFRARLRVELEEERTMSVGAKQAERKLNPARAGFRTITPRSEEHTSELQSRFGISYAVFCLKKK